MALVQNHYSVLGSRFYAGPAPRFVEDKALNADLKFLKNIGVNRIISLIKMEPDSDEFQGYQTYQNLVPTYDMGWSEFGIPDFGIPDYQETRQFLVSIDAWLAQGENLYLHCHAGIGRTGLIVGAYLIHSGSIDVNGVLEKIAFLRKKTPRGNFQSPETPEQIEWLLGFKVK